MSTLDNIMWQNKFDGSHYFLHPQWKTFPFTVQISEVTCSENIGTPSTLTIKQRPWLFSMSCLSQITQDKCCHGNAGLANDDINVAPVK